MNALSLEYHDVVRGEDPDVSGFPGAGPGSYKLSEQHFRRHLHAIAEALDGRSVTVIDPLPGGTESPVLHLTFDDGGVSAYAVTADLLESYGWRGHFFVATDFIGKSSFLSKEQIRELATRGHLLGVHSASHPARMGACSWDELVREWRVSVEVMSDILGVRVSVGSVPGGFYTHSVARAAALVGMKCLFTSEPVATPWRVDGCMVLGRYSIRKWTDPGFVGELAGGHLRPRITQWILYRGLRALRTVGGPLYLGIRRQVWSAVDRLHGPRTGS